MSYGCLSPKLNGKPHTVITRVYNVPSEELLKRLPSIQPFVISELMGEGLKSSDTVYTMWGDVEKEEVYDCVRVKNNKHPVVSEKYDAQFDEHHNLIHSSFVSQKERIKDYKTKEKVIETKKGELHCSNEYDSFGKLACKTEDTSLIHLMDDTEQLNRNYKTITYFNEEGKIIKKESDNTAIFFSYNGELLTSMKKYYAYEVYNLFEQDKKYDFRYEEKYVYDATNNLVKIVRENADGDVLLLEEREYNIDGKLICKTSKTNEGVSRTRYYDNKRIRISKGERQWDNKQKYVQYTVELLDVYGNVVEFYYRNKSKKYNTKKKIWVTENPYVSKKTIKYTYDSYGNWTRMDYWRDGRNTNFVIRDIEYYE